MPGISTSVMTRSHDCDRAMASAACASGAWQTSKPPRLPSTWVMNRAVTMSSSTTMIRPIAPGLPLLIPLRPRSQRAIRLSQADE